jgi:hypothetical protein
VPLAGVGPAEFAIPLPFVPEQSRTRDSVGAMGADVHKTVPTAVSGDTGIVAGGVKLIVAAAPLS